MLANRTANLAVTYPVLCWLYCTTVPIPDFSDNYLGDNYLNCIYNYRYQNLSKLLFLHPSCNGSPPFVLLNLQKGENRLRHARFNSLRVTTSQNHTNEFLFGVCLIDLHCCSPYQLLEHTCRTKRPRKRVIPLDSSSHSEC